MRSKPARWANSLRRIGLVAVALATLLMLAACSNPTDSTEYADLSAQRDQLVGQIAETQSDLDSFLAVEGVSSVADLEAVAVELDATEARLAEQNSQLSSELAQLEETIIDLAEEGQAARAVVDSASNDLSDLQSLNRRLESGDF